MNNSQSPVLEASARANEYFRKEDVTVSAKNIGINIDNYDMREIIMGMNIEKEHGSMYGNDVNVTGDQAEPTLKLVIAHLREDPNYYSALIDFKKQRETEKNNEPQNGIAQGSLNESEILSAAYLIVALKNIDKNPNFYSNSLNKRERISESVRAAFYNKSMLRSLFSGSPLFENIQNNKIQNMQEIYRVGAGILPICKATGRVLLGRRGRNSSEAGKWCNFGGKLNVDNGESEENVLNIAKREFTEETGHTGFYNVIPAFQYVTSSNSFKFYNHIGIFDDEFTPTLNSEHDEAQWMTLNQIYGIPKEQIHFGIQNLFNDKASMDTIKKYAK